MNLTNAEIKYSGYKKNGDIHGTVLYPGVMVAPVQNKLLAKIMDNRDNLTIFDPFHGSGTALYEAGYINDTSRLVGFDINPLANLITLVKLNGVDFETINQDIINIQFHLNSGEYDLVSFDKINKWFKQDIIVSLSRIRSAIMSIKNQRNRRYFWIIMCDLIRRYSNTRSSTYKLHIKEQDKIDNIQNDVIDVFLKNVTDKNYIFDKEFEFTDIRLCNTLDEILTITDNSVDIVITSPPYGDNQTTVPYGQFSYLPLKFIDDRDLNLQGWELINSSSIDSNSVGGNLTTNEMSETQSRYIKWYLSRISDDKKGKVKRFFADYFVFLDNLIRISSEHIIITLGNRTVDGQRINLTNITKKYLLSNDFIAEYELNRSIGNKRIPSKTSIVNGKNVSSMTKEYVLVLKKNIINNCLERPLCKN